MAIARPKGVPIKTIATIMNKNGYGLILKKGSPLRKPVDFKGKEILYNTASLEGTFMESFLGSAGLKRNDVKLLGVDSSAKASAVLAGKSDAAVAPVPYYIGLLAGRQEIDSLLFSDFGDTMVDIGIIANEDVIKQKGPALKAFLTVLSRAYQFTLDGGVQEAAAAMVAARPDANVDATAAVNMFHAYAKHIPSPSTQGKPIGFISDQNWTETVDTLKRLGLVPKETKAQDMYDTSFMPR
jgi:NitT/TauT family transport system substrate-binding protein